MTRLQNHWMVYAGGTMVRVSRDQVDVILEARRMFSMQERKESWAEPGEPEVSIDAPDLVEIMDIHGGRAHLSPTHVSAIIEWKPELVDEAQEFTAEWKALYEQKAPGYKTEYLVKPDGIEE
jgi:hypothetical protein